MKNSEIPYDEWIAELMREHSDEGMTVREIRAKTGVGKEAIRRKLGEFQDQGRIKLVRRRRNRMDGVAFWEPAYIILPQPKKEKRK
jgi:hypothetical protein